jgi:ABC-2 type transport system permease protein
VRSAVADKYAKSFELGLRAGFEYRVNFIFSIASAIAPIVIQTALWIVLYGSDPSESFFGFTFKQMVAYTVIAQLVNRLGRTGFEYEMNSDIKTGSLDRFLVKPVSYFGFRLSSFLGDKAVQSAVMGVLLALAVAALAVFFSFALSAVAVGLFVIALAMAFVLNFLIFWCVGLMGFWLTEIGFLFEAVRIVIVAASGGILPLAVFGPGAERVLGLLPFRFTIQFPTELLTGRVAPSEAPGFFAIAGAWIVILGLLGQAAWKTGIRRFAAVGS